MTNIDSEPEKQRFKSLYQKRAAHYNLTANLFYLLGFRQGAYRKKAVAALNLKQGDTVVDIGCGTGLNISMLEKRIGPNRKIIGIDFSAAVLNEAHKHIANQGWQNIDLVECDAATCEFPPDINAVFSSFALTPVPEYDTVISNAAKALKKGGNMALLELRRPGHTPGWLVKLARIGLRPFGVKPVHATYKPWISMEKYFVR